MKTLIETDRLLLKNISLDDTKEMFRLHSDPDVQKYTGEPIVESLQEMERMIQLRIKNYDKIGYGRWATFIKKDMKFIGWAGLAYLPEFDEVDLGYRFLPEYWGLGFATEASNAILNYAFNKLHLKKVMAIAMKENTASIRVMQKLGMVFDKYAPYEPEGVDVAWYLCNRQLFNENRNHQE